MDRYLVISSDCHTGPPAEVFTNYLDPQYREAYEQAMVGQRKAEPEGTLESKFQGSDRNPDMQQTFLSAEPVKEGGQQGAWDPVVRARELDRDGVAAEILFPVPQTPRGVTHGVPPFMAGLMARSERSALGNIPYELQIAGARAYNRWLAELCAHNPGRHGGAIICPMDDINVVVEEVRKSHKAGLRGGVLLPAIGWATTEVESMYHHPRFEPLWDVCEELGLALLTHPLVSGIDYGDLPGKGLLFASEVFSPPHRTFWFLLWSGVFERHPKLKLVITEAGGGWVPYMLWRFDELYGGRKGQAARQSLTRLPSEYWADHGFIGASPPVGRLEVEQRDVIGTRNLMWGSDYPHFEGTWPYSFERMKVMFGGIPEEDIRLMLGESAVSVYGFDREKLLPIAERIGPKVSDFAETPKYGAKEFASLWTDREALAELAKR